MERQLEAIFSAVFEIPTGQQVRALSQLTFPKWDSLAHVTLMAAVESEFGIEIDIADSLELTSFEAVHVYLEDRGK